MNKLIELMKSKPILSSVILILLSNAFVIGIVFSALYLRCNTLSLPILIHGLIYITGCTGFLSITSKELYLQLNTQPPTTFNDIIGSLIIFLPLLIWGLFVKL